MRRHPRRLALSMKQAAAAAAASRTDEEVNPGQSRRTPAPCTPPTDRGPTTRRGVARLSWEAANRGRPVLPMAGADNPLAAAAQGFLARLFSILLPR